MNAFRETAERLDKNFGFTTEAALYHITMRHVAHTLHLDTALAVS